MTTQTSIRQKADNLASAARQSTMPVAMIEDRLASIFNQLPAAIIILDKNGTVIGYNPAAIDLLGEPLFAQSWWQVIQRVFVQHAEQEGDLRLEDGRIVNLETCPMGSHPGQIIMAHEVTRMRSLEGRIRRYQRLNESGELAARLAHQLRTPLAAALLYADQIRDQALSTVKRHEFADKLKSRLRSIESHVSDMLLLVNAPDKRDFVLTDTRTWLQQLVKQQEQYADLLDCDLSNTYPIRIHSSALMGAVMNCINNAIEAKADQVLLSVKADEAAKQLHLVIEDNGRGMPETVREQACLPFYTSKKQGTGLGLAVVNSVLRAHGGSMKIESVVRKGTRIILTLPREPS